MPNTKRKYIILLFIFGVLLMLAGSALAHGDAPENDGHHDNDSHAASVENPTYYADIEPILQANCAGCHQAGGIGHIFLDIDDVSQVTDSELAKDIAYLTDIGYMPPWPPSAESQPLAHERTLTPDEIALINVWADQGAPLGNVVDRVEVTPTNIPTIDPNLVLTMPEPYTPSGELLDDYRCFLLDPQLTEDSVITASHFEPGNDEIAHHAIFFIVGDTEAAEAEQRSGADGRAGWECFGGTGLNSSRNASPDEIDPQRLLAALAEQGVNAREFIAAFNALRAENPSLSLRTLDETALAALIEETGVDVRQLIADLGVDIASMSDSGMSGSVGGWVPGAVPLASPDDTGIYLPANSKIVLQMHYNLYQTYFSDNVSDQSTMLLETTPFTDDMTLLNATSLLAPVEIPCAERVDNVNCDREIARQDNVNPRTSNALLWMCDQSLATYASNTADNAYGYCDYPITQDMYLLSVGPHMHELGTQARILLNPDTADETILIDIPEWDFHWQGQYSFVQPIELNAGDTIRVECWWDNSDGERYIVWGEGTQDEMCFHFTRFLIPDDGKTLTDYGFTEIE